MDLFNLVKLNETVDVLQKRVQSIETDIKDVCNNTQYVANQVRASEKEEFTTMQKVLPPSPQHTIRRNPTSTNLMNGFMTTMNTQWQLSLTQKGLRIDTNIASLHDLYDILLSGVSQFDLSGGCMHENHLDSASSQSSSSTNTTDIHRPDTATVLKKKPLWKSRLKTFPLYSSWEPERNQEDASSQDGIVHDQRIMQHMINIYRECFLCLPCIDPSNSIAVRYENGTLDPLLANSVFAWTARHAAIYHNLFPGKDPNQVGKPFFTKAKELLKERFMKTSVDTMHSLIIMYIYAIGIPGGQKAEVESEAYIYLGLAIRMCLDLKMHQESKSDNPYEQEKHRRFFWVTYFLETLGSIHSDKPFSLPPKNVITVSFPTLMEHEKTGEARYRVQFMIQRFKITRIYRNIIYKTAEEKPLLSQISAIDKELENWYSNLPTYMKYEQGDIHKRQWDSTSFREQACIKLNLEYNFQLCQLYGLFFSKSIEDEEQPSTIEVLSREICLKAARSTIELLECWVQMRQLWCHFSLENLMMTTMIYGNILNQPNDPKREEAKSNLEKMAHILMSAPVRHHKYVLTLVKRIEDIFRETLHTELVLHPPKEEQHRTKKENEKDFIPQPQPILPSSSSVPNATLTNPLAPSNAMFHMLDVASASSPFDMHKSTNLTDDVHFSDFVYTPTLLNYNTPSNTTTTGIMGSNAYGKKIDYNASSPYNYNYAYNNNTKTPNSATPTPHLHQQQFNHTPPTSWVGLDTVNANLSVMVNQPPPEENTQPYLGIPYKPPVSHPSTSASIPKTFYNTTNYPTSGNGNGGNYY